jgi:prepilin-type N-terminal cleavage/methylation domain-containing protein
MDRLSRDRASGPIDLAGQRAGRGGPRAGFTLIEVMVALSILAAGLLTVAAAQLHAMRGGSSGRHSSAAAAVAHSQLENFQRMSFTGGSLDDTAGAWQASPDNPYQNVIETADGDVVEMTYTMQWRITDVDDELKTVDVQVNWNEPQRPGRSVTLSTRLHDDPPTGG